MATITFFQNIKAEFPGVQYVSAVLKKHGHNCNMVIDTQPAGFVKALKKNIPDVIGFSLMSGMQHWALNVCREVKKEFPDIKVVFGGVHPTYFPEVIEEEGVDIICRGEGEYAMLDLMNALDNNSDIANILNLWVKQKDRIYKNDLRHLIENLDELPFMDLELYYDNYPFLKNLSVKNFLGVRGCPYDCSFCFNHKLKEMYRGKGKYTRFRSKENIIEEILQVKSRYDFKRVFFISDIMFINKRWALDFLRYYREKINLPYIGLIRADMLDEELVRELKTSGCCIARFGMESGNEKLRNEILKKNLSDDQIIKTAGLLTKYGIKFRAYCMTGLPGETVEQAFETIDLNIRIKTAYPWCSVYNPYSGTKIVDYAKEEGFLDKDFDINSIDDSYYKGSVMKNNNINELLNIQRFFQTAVLFPWTLPLIKKLVKLPPNPLFNLWFQFIYFLVYIKSEGLRVQEVLSFSLHYMKVFYKKK
ncbi:MAG: radical SAM protein [Nitrospiraceae bacterium]|nr:MAG: radical SAM protein [Nitrospiraceae bacterium]